MKYIIKNCPAKDFGYKTCSNSDKPCKDITDCVMKRIVELCDINADKVLYEGKTLKFVEGNPLAKKILQLLEIEEVDEN